MEKKKKTSKDIEFPTILPDETRYVKRFQGYTQRDDYIEIQRRDKAITGLNRVYTFNLLPSKVSFSSLFLENRDRQSFE